MWDLQNNAFKKLSPLKLFMDAASKLIQQDLLPANVVTPVFDTVQTCTACQGDCSQCGQESVPVVLVATLAQPVPLFLHLFVKNPLSRPFNPPKYLPLQKLGLAEGGFYILKACLGQKGKSYFVLSEFMQKYIFFEGTSAPKAIKTVKFNGIFLLQYKYVPFKFSTAVILPEPEGSFLNSFTTDQGGGKLCRGCILIHYIPLKN